MKDITTQIREAALQAWSLPIAEHNDPKKRFIAIFEKGANFALSLDRWISVEEAEPYRADGTGQLGKLAEPIPVSRIVTDQPQQPTGKELLEALREWCAKPDEEFPEYNQGQGESSKYLLEFAEQWLETKEQEKK